MVKEKVQINPHLTLTVCVNPSIALIPVINYSEWKLTEEEKAAPLRALHQAYYHQGILS